MKKFVVLKKGDQGVSGKHVVLAYTFVAHSINEDYLVRLQGRGTSDAQTTSTIPSLQKW